VTRMFVAGSSNQLVLGQESYQKDHMNDGFFILHPSKDLYNYYVSLHLSSSIPARDFAKAWGRLPDGRSREHLVRDEQIHLCQESYQKDHMNDGFFILHPSKDLYNYYVSLHHIRGLHLSSSIPARDFAKAWGRLPDGRSREHLVRDEQ
jgi:hypothetical protein